MDEERDQRRLSEVLRGYVQEQIKRTKWEQNGFFNGLFPFALFCVKIKEIILSKMFIEERFC